MTSFHNATPKNSDDQYNNKHGSQEYNNNKRGIQGRSTLLKSIDAQRVSKKERLAANTMMSAPDASTKNSYVEICPVGRWVHIDEAVNQITKNGNVQSLRERHKIDLSFAIEKCSSKIRFFTNVEFVYICRERTGEALSSMTLTLPKLFVKLTNYLSDKSSWASPESSMADLFQQYTGFGSIQGKH